MDVHGGEKSIILDGTTDGIFLGDQLVDLLKKDHTIEFSIYYADDKRSIFIGNYDTESHNSEYWRETGQRFRTWWDNGMIQEKWSNQFLNPLETQTITIKLQKSTNKVEVYKNGQLMESRVDTRYGNYNYDWTKVWIGRDNVNDSTRGLNGQIYSVRIYNGLLSNDEIQKNYNIDKTRFDYLDYDNVNYVTSNLILHYDGMNNTGTGHSSSTTVWKDLSGNNKDGTLNGCTWRRRQYYIRRNNRWNIFRE